MVTQSVASIGSSCRNAVTEAQVALGYLLIFSFSPLLNYNDVSFFHPFLTELWPRFKLGAQSAFSVSYRSAGCPGGKQTRS